MARHAAPLQAQAAKPSAKAGARPPARPPISPYREAAKLMTWQRIMQTRAQSAGPTPTAAAAPAAPAGGLPQPLRAGIEASSNFAMDDVRVHRNSSEPAKLGALAYAQGSNIHLGPGQERHLPHEAWHVVQQKQGRVRATTQLKGRRVNIDAALEREADAMATHLHFSLARPAEAERRIVGQPAAGAGVMQCKLIYSAKAMESEQKSLADPGQKPRQWLQAAEMLQIKKLAQALGQDPIAYEKGQAPNLKGDKLNYVVGHIYVDNPKLAGILSARTMAKDFIAGGIESPSTLKLLACRGNELGVGLADQFDHRHKDVTVIASDLPVSASGVGIASYEHFSKDEPEPEKNAADRPLWEARRAVASARKDLLKGTVTHQKAIISLRKAKKKDLAKLENKGGQEEAIASINAAYGEKEEAEITAFLNDATEFYNWAVSQINKATGKGSARSSEAFATPTAEGWFKYWHGEDTGWPLFEDEAAHSTDLPVAGASVGPAAAAQTLI